MKFLNLFLTLFLVYACSPVFAYVVPTYRDLKPATQVMIEKQSFGTPIVASASAIVTSTAGSISSAAATLSTFTAQPDIPRNVTITPTGTTANVASCTVVVNGTNYFGSSISENFVFAASASTVTTGSKAFKTISSVAFPANCEISPYGATWSIGVGEKLGLKRCMAAAGDFVSSHVDGVYSASRPTVVANASAVHSNTVDFSETMNGSASFVGYFIQNFACLP